MASELFCLSHCFFTNHTFKKVRIQVIETDLVPAHSLIFFQSLFLTKDEILKDCFNAFLTALNLSLKLRAVSLAH